MTPKPHAQLGDRNSARGGTKEREHVEFMSDLLGEGDRVPCCRVCGHVKPRDGWEKPCRGPVERG